jgi:MYXO-CTERM domain-containing protein
MAGLVWTDGKKNSTVTFRAWDKNGKLIGKIKTTLGDSSRKGTTSEDRFFGLVSTKGISKIQILSNYSNFEIDHLQFSYALAVVPLPPAAALGLAGLAGAAMWRRSLTRRQRMA